MRDLVRQGREALLDIGNESRAAGAREEALFGELLGLLISDHVGAERSLDDMEEAEALDAGDDLAEFCIAELARNRRRHNGVHLVVLVVAALLQEIHRVENERLVDDRAERALVDAGAAGDALLVVDMRCAMVFAAHADRLDLAGALARALLVHNRAVRADL